jgi:F-type H+-transporting ATPase subunit a
MIPFSFTTTSHFLITLALLFFYIFKDITIVGFQKHGLHFLKITEQEMREDP